MSPFLVSFQTEIASTTRPIAAISRGDHPAARQSLTHSIIITTFRDRHHFNLTWKSNCAYSGARKRQHSSSHFYCVLSEEKFSLIKKKGKGFLESKATLKSVTVGSSHPHGHEKAKFRLLSTKTPYMPVPNAAPWGSIPEKYWREIMQHTLQTPKKVWNRYALSSCSHIWAACRFFQMLFTGTDGVRFGKARSNLRSKFLFYRCGRKKCTDQTLMVSYAIPESLYVTVCLFMQ